MTETLTVPIPEEVVEDILYYGGMESDLGELTEECQTFVAKLATIKRKGKGKRLYREVNQEEFDEVADEIGEILNYVVIRLDEELDAWYSTHTERADMRRYRQKVTRFVDRFIDPPADE